MIMILCLILALSALIVLMFIRLVEKDDVDIIEFILHCLATIMVFCALVVYGCLPKAIDVYQNKTTLEITYQDSIAVDSVVIFKNK